METQAKNLSRRNTQSAVQKPNSKFQKKDINQSYNLQPNRHKREFSGITQNNQPPPLAIGPDSFMFTSQSGNLQATNLKNPFQYSEKHQKLFTPHEYIHFSTKVNSTKDNYINSLKQLGFESAPFLKDRNLNDIYQKTNNLMGKSYSSKYIGIIDNNMGVLSQRKKMDLLEPEQINVKQKNLRTEKARLQSSSRQKQKLIQQQQKLLEQKNQDEIDQIEIDKLQSNPITNLETPQPDMYDTYIVSKYSLPKSLKTVKVTRNNDNQLHKFKLDQWHSQQIQGITDHKDNLLNYQWQRKTELAQQMHQTQKLKQQQFQETQNQISNNGSQLKDSAVINNNNKNNTEQSELRDQLEFQQNEMQQNILSGRQTLGQNQQIENNNNNNTIQTEQSQDQFQNQINDEEQLKQQIQQQYKGPKQKKIVNRKLKNSSFNRKKPVQGYKETDDGICYAVIEKPMKKEIISYSRLLMKSNQVNPNQQMLQIGQINNSNSNQFGQNYPNNTNKFMINKKKYDKKVQNIEELIDYKQNQNLYERFQKLDQNKQILQNYQQQQFLQQQQNIQEIDPQQIYKESQQQQQTPSFQY